MLNLPGFVFVLAVVVGKRQDTFVGRMQNQTKAWSESMPFFDCSADAAAITTQTSAVESRAEMLGLVKGAAPHKQPMQSGWTPLPTQDFVGDFFTSKGRIVPDVSAWSHFGTRPSWSYTDGAATDRPTRTSIPGAGNGMPIPAAGMPMPAASVPTTSCSIPISDAGLQRRFRRDPLEPTGFLPEWGVARQHWGL